MENKELQISNTEIENEVVDDVINIHLTEEVNILMLMSAIDNIVDAVAEQDFAYELLDLVESYYVLKLFTDVEIPMTDEEDIPDYVKCYELCVAYDIKNAIWDESVILSEYLSYLEKNVWRKLEYRKSNTAQQKLTEALEEFYIVIDMLAEGAEYIQSDEKMSELNDKLSQMNDMVNSLKNIDIVAK